MGGYVHSLPVTTEPSRALGDEVWGYPKVVGDIELTESGQRRRIRVAIDGEQFITLEIDQPPEFDFSVSATTESYTVLDGTVIREPLSFDGELGMRLPSKRASYTLGDWGRSKYSTSVSEHLFGATGGGRSSFIPANRSTLSSHDPMPRTHCCAREASHPSTTYVNTPDTTPTTTATPIITLSVTRSSPNRW
ncbi:acetoacetate decarboxylase family protein [Halocatena marina]|uniref:Acetoacetate decarboxylase family protein n=1 Tax=Halocatena marina TaxID=2934937 RepID=A0ABD5YUX0_9EURY